MRICLLVEEFTVGTLRRIGVLRLHIIAFSSFGHQHLTRYRLICTAEAVEIYPAAYPASLFITAIPDYGMFRLP